MKSLRAAIPPFLPDNCVRKSKKSPITEFQLHKAVAEVLTRSSRPGVLWFTVNNNPRSKVSGALNKILGARAGVPDIIIGHRGKTYCLELKIQSGRWSDSQQAFAGEAMTAGWEYRVAWGLDQAIKQLEEWDVIRLRGRV